MIIAGSFFSCCYSILATSRNKIEKKTFSEGYKFLWDIRILVCLTSENINFFFLIGKGKISMQLQEVITPVGMRMGAGTNRNGRKTPKPCWLGFGFQPMVMGSLSSAHTSLRRARVVHCGALWRLNKQSICLSPVSA